MPDIDAMEAVRLCEAADFKEDTTRCVVLSWSPRTTIPNQCPNPRGYGPDGRYCEKHWTNLGGGKP